MRVSFSENTEVHVFDHNKEYSSTHPLGKDEVPAIKIDIGTTYTYMGVRQHIRVEIITNDEGSKFTPSYCIDIIDLDVVCLEV